MRTSPVLMVAATVQGVLLPETWGRPARPLGLAELLLLEALARPDAPPPQRAIAALRRRGADPESLGPLVDDLCARNLLIANDAAPEAGAGSPEPPVVERPLADDEQLVLTTPMLLRIGTHGFEQVDHDGTLRARLSADQLFAADHLRKPITVAEAWRAYEGDRRGGGLDRGAFDALLRRLAAVGMLQSFRLADPSRERALSREDRDIRRAVARQANLKRVVARALEEHDAQEQARFERTGVRRLPVVPVHFQWQIPPLALGMVIAYAKAHEGGTLAELLDFRPSWLTEPERDVLGNATPVVYLFSHYTWSTPQNLAMSARVKAANAQAITIHGGPNVPKYVGDVEAYFHDHPHVDVTVRGEGEATAAATLAALAHWHAAGDARRVLDLSMLDGVTGISFRLGDRIVHNPDRPRIEHLDDLPSPYLTGVFDRYAEASIEAAVIETNRGCPYGCTFCDWGSATASRIRQFSLERVFAELEWCGRNRVQVVAVADANFGIFERDVAIAEKLAAVKREHGFPHHFGVNYAKNSIKHLSPIVKTLVKAGMIAYGQLSLQSMDKDTLATVKRSNIKVEKYHELASEFRSAGLPLFVDLMMGLPGATLDSFRNDLQQTCDREVIAKVYPTQLLVNSPMNEAGYRKQHGITVAPGEIVSACTTFTREDFEEMQRLRRVYLLLEKFGVLRHVGRYIRAERGIREIDFYERIWRDALADRARWPVIAFTLDVVPSIMVPPGRWQHFLAEVRRWVVEVLGVADDSTLDTVFAVQDLVLPARHRRFPESVTLDHDYAAWHQAMLAAKDSGHYDDWPAHVEPLRTFPPGTLTVTDPHEVCVLGIGQSVDSDSFGAWEVGSPISRPVTPLHTVLN